MNMEFVEEMLADDHAHIELLFGVHARLDVLIFEHCALIATLRNDGEIDASHSAKNELATLFDLQKRVLEHPVSVQQNLKANSAKF